MQTGNYSKFNGEYMHIWVYLQRAETLREKSPICDLLLVLTPLYSLIPLENKSLRSHACTHSLSAGTLKIPLHQGRMCIREY